MGNEFKGSEDSEQSDGLDEIKIGLTEDHLEDWDADNDKIELIPVVL